MAVHPAYASLCRASGAVMGAGIFVVLAVVLSSRTTTSVDERHLRVHVAPGETVGVPLVNHAVGHRALADTDARAGRVHASRLNHGADFPSLGSLGDDCLQTWTPLGTAVGGATPAWFNGPGRSVVDVYGACLPRDACARVWAGTTTLAAPPERAHACPVTCVLPTGPSAWVGAGATVAGGSRTIAECPANLSATTRLNWALMGNGTALPDVPADAAYWEVALRLALPAGYARAHVLAPDLTGFNEAWTGQPTVLVRVPTSVTALTLEPPETTILSLAARVVPVPFDASTVPAAHLDCACAATYAYVTPGALPTEVTISSGVYLWVVPEYSTLILALFYARPAATPRVLAYNGVALTPPRLFDGLLYLPNDVTTVVVESLSVRALDAVFALGYCPCPSVIVTPVFGGEYVPATRGTGTYDALGWYTPATLAYYTHVADAADVHVLTFAANTSLYARTVDGARNLLATLEAPGEHVVAVPAGLADIAAFQVAGYLELHLFTGDAPERRRAVHTGVLRPYRAVPQPAQRLASPWSLQARGRSRFVGMDACTAVFTAQRPGEDLLWTVTPEPVLAYASPLVRPARAPVQLPCGMWVDADYSAVAGAPGPTPSLLDDGYVSVGVHWAAAQIPRVPRLFLHHREAWQVTAYDVRGHRPCSCHLQIQDGLVVGVAPGPAGVWLPRLTDVLVDRVHTVTTFDHSVPLAQIYNDLELPATPDTDVLLTVLNPRLTFVGRQAPAATTFLVGTVVE